MQGLDPDGAYIRFPTGPDGIENVQEIVIKLFTFSRSRYDLCELYILGCKEGGGENTTEYSNSVRLGAVSKII